MAPWSNPDYYVKTICEDKEVHTFTEYPNQKPSEFIRGYVNAKDKDNRWRKVVGRYDPTTNKFVADRRGKWAFLLVHELAPFYALTNNPEIPPAVRPEHLGPPDDRMKRLKEAFPLDD